MIVLAIHRVHVVNFRIRYKIESHRLKNHKTLIHLRDW